MDVFFTDTQRKRLTELNAGEEYKDCSFSSREQREKEFKKFEAELLKKAKVRLERLKNETRQPELVRLRTDLEKALTGIGFIQVATPVILSKKLLEKMTITSEHPLFKQVFWLSDNKCLRPMLAPNLYYISKDLLRLWEKPVRIFEIGSCFRKESQGSNHLNEFTMLNLVEWGLPEQNKQERIEELAGKVMKGAGIGGYHFERTDCVVYGDTTDVMYGEVELGSSSMGPHFLDEKWGITTTWVGIGFGLERLLMVREGTCNIHSMGRSISYLNGVRLNI
ncbi:MAG TPA: pyrrolysine--tRNA(Pyl) ligase large subunit [Desulfitobacteriaceae bacterium]|nr:pyrrolysine--tRNA(Pyl) ligase large subunit [Desulfitobacteriaceae bacterium]